jgi:hypothetical protein
MPLNAVPLPLQEKFNADPILVPQSPAWDSVPEGRSIRALLRTLKSAPLNLFDPAQLFSSVQDYLVVGEALSHRGIC